MKVEGWHQDFQNASICAKFPLQKVLSGLVVDLLQ